MANPTDTETSETLKNSRAVEEEPHLRNLSRPRGKGRDGNIDSGSPRGDRASATMEPVELEQTPTGAKPDHAGGTLKTPIGDTIVQSAGVAHLSGLTLRFPLGTGIRPGELVVVGHKPFEVRKERLFTMMFVIKGVVAMVLGVLAVIGVASLSSVTSGGTITGVVVDRQSGRIIPNAQVQIEGGPATATNAAGLYTFTDALSGLLKVTAMAPGYEPQSGTVVGPSKGAAQMAFALNPINAEALNLTSIPRATQAPVPVDASSADADEAVAYGNIVLETDLNDFMVFVDNVLYGKNAKKVQRMSAGDHRVVVQVDGFEDYSASVAVKARATQTLTIAKANLVPRVDTVKRAKQHFAEAKEFIDKGLWEQAITAYNTGLQDDPQNPEALRYRGWAYAKSGNAEKARADFLQAATVNEESNRFLDAVACAGHLIELDPDNSESYLRRSGYYIKLREYAKAIDDCEMAVRKDKKSSKAQLALAEAYFTAGDYKHAAKEFDKGRKLTDNPQDVYVRLLISLARGGEDDQVRRKYKDFSASATPEFQKDLRQNPEWLRVLQIVDPTKRSEG